MNMPLRTPEWSFRNLLRVTLAATLTLVCASPFARAQDVVYPDAAFSGTNAGRAGIVDITKPPYNAVSDGSVDVTLTIKQAMQDLFTQREAHSKKGQRLTIYFPSGTYAISDTLDWWYNTTSIPDARLQFQGQNRASTVLKLKDLAPGFTSTTSPKAMIFTRSAIGTSGTTNNGYDNSIMDMTIDVGSGNAGAIGIDYLANNTGSLRNLLVRASGANPVGYTGISMTRQYPGPGLLKNVEVRGFNYGIDISWLDYGMWMENITLVNQGVAGIRNNQNSLAIRTLTSTNAKPAILQTSPDSMMVLIDSSLKGGTSTVNAIENYGGLFVRNTVTSGYGLAIKNYATAGTDVPNGTVASFVSHAVLKTVSTSADVSLNLPISDTPVYTDNDFSHWANVKDYGAVADSGADATAGIQGALTSGKSTIYFPPGEYLLSGTLSVSGTVRRILGLGVSIRPKQGAYTDANNPRPVFTVNTSNSLQIDGMHLWPHWTGSSGGAYAVLHSGTSTLTLTNFQADLHHIYENRAGSGNLFLENVAGAPWYFNYPGQKIWARQMNPENTGTKIVNNGCTLWILGFKTENPGTAIDTKGGGSTEVLGGMLYPKTAPTTPAFTSTDSRISLSYVSQAYNTPTVDYAIQVRETTGTFTGTLTRAFAYRRTYGSKLPLFTGFPAEIIIDNTDPQVTLTPANGWPASTSTSGYYGSNYFTNQGVGAGTKSVRYTPNIPATGHYEVFARWTAGTNRPPVVPFKITSLGTSTTVNVNEQTNNGVWVSLGVFPFTAGTAGYVELLTNGTAGYYVIADAVKFVFDSP